MWAVGSIRDTKCIIFTFFTCNAPDLWIKPLFIFPYYHGKTANQPATMPARHLKTKTCLYRSLSLLEKNAFDNIIFKCIYTDTVDIIMIC